MWYTPKGAQKIFNKVITVQLCTLSSVGYDTDFSKWGEKQYYYLLPFLQGNNALFITFFLLPQSV